MVHRIEMDELISCNEDSCFMEAAYDYMLHTSEKAKAIHGALVKASEKLYRALPEEAYDLFGRQIGYDFLFGLEFGMTLYKMMDALKQEDEAYIAQIYRLVEETTPLEEGFGR